MPKWKEQSIKIGSETTYPYPGKEHYEAKGDNGTFLEQDLNGYEAQQGRNADRDNNFYQEPKLAEPQPTGLDDSYSVIINA